MKKKRRQFVSWFTNYIWIFLICIVLACIAFHFFLSVLNEQVNSTLSVSSDQMRSFYESEFEKQQLCSYSALNSYNIVNLPENFSSENTGFRNKSIGNAVSELSHAFANIDSVNNCVVIYDNTDAAITFSGYIPKKAAYNLYFEKSFPEYEKWQKEMFSFDGVSKYLRVKTTEGSQLVSLYKWKNGGNTIVAVLFIDTNVLINRAAGESSGNRIFGILSESGDVLLTNSDADISKYKEINGNIEINGADYYAASTSSGDEKLRYIVLLPENQYKVKVRLVTGIALVSGLLCLILCLFAAYYFAKKEYVPIERIIKKIGTEREEGESEISFIEKELEKIIEKNLSITLRLNQKGIRLRETSLANLIKYKCEMTPEELYEEFGIDLRTSSCVLILFEIMSSGVFKETDTNNIKFVISNVFSELMENSAKCYFIQVEKQYVCIVNSDDNNIGDIVYENLEFLSDFVLENFGIDLKCAISKKADIYGLPELYSQAQELMKLETVNWRILVHDEIVEYISEAHTPVAEEEKNLVQLEDRTERIHMYINENFTDPMLNISAVASDFGITINHLSRSFRQRYGIKPSEYLLKCRVEKAAEMLTTTNLNVTEVGAQCGFLNTGMFIRAFKKNYGTTPGMYANL